MPKLLNPKIKDTSIIGSCPVCEYELGYNYCSNPHPINCTYASFIPGHIVCPVCETDFSVGDIYKLTSEDQIHTYKEDLTEEIQKYKEALEYKQTFQETASVKDKIFSQFYKKTKSFKSLTKTIKITYPSKSIPTRPDYIYELSVDINHNEVFIINTLSLESKSINLGRTWSSIKKWRQIKSIEEAINTPESIKNEIEEYNKELNLLKLKYSRAYKTVGTKQYLQSILPKF